MMHPVYAPGRRCRPARVFLPFCLACTGLLLIGFLSVAAALEVPGYSGYVNDYASMISPEARQRLEQTLSSFDRSDSTQVAILTIDTLEGDPIEDFSIRVVDQWKVGQKGKDNGVLFLVAKNDRKMRIEVGRGLEHILTDLAAGRIIDTVVAPRFKEGHFDEGFEAGITAIIQTTRGEYSAEPGADGSRGEENVERVFNYLFFGMGILYFLSMNSRTLGMAGGAVLLPLFFFLGLPGLFSWAVLLILVPVGALIGLAISYLLSAMPKHTGRGRRGGYYTGGYSGGGFGGGGFGGFGGGSFGGGGASGRW